ncbi:uncharacterized protein [Triticum aestivum]|uniref:uncharacterized protein isoform X1 n=1 Tax=Triticum aestivum TaxID=4565 RepID=UPI001D023450|nr:uncharacterized protein LOC123066946 isoform X1 [Triticum aestivum]XP_044345865.1 uncharacterized protein LOC123066946 isoform X1 [Triticum aestivum]XP_044345871.1 uncharacterized protein LOC123066946 isoform X1 [Triticum aestivum]XP_044345876.1 uncharacterized protein LOC123066946 isoform X1 [Triticum aestivum]
MSSRSTSRPRKSPWRHGRCRWFVHNPRRRSWTPKRVKGASSLLQLLSIPRIRWSSSNKDDDKIELTRAEVESLRSEIADADERESQLKARLENIDEVLRYAFLSRYLHIRSRWTQLPGEPPIIDDADVDDWLPRFVVLQAVFILLSEVYRPEPAGIAAAARRGTHVLPRRWRSTTTSLSGAYTVAVPQDSEGGAWAVETEEEAETAAVPAAATMATTSKRKTTKCIRPPCAGLGSTQL